MDVLMRNLCECHFAYLLNRKSIFIFIIANVFVILYYIANVDDFPTLNFENYYQTSLIMIKVSFSFITIYLMAVSIYKQNDYYVYYLLTSNVNRKNYIASKLVLIMFIILVDFCLLFITFLGVGFIFNKGFYFNQLFIWGFIGTYLIVVIYGLYAMILMQFFQNIFIIAIPFMLLIITNDMDLDSDFSRIINVFLPVMTSFSFYKCFNLVWLFSMLFYFNIKVYCYKDLNY